VARRVLASPGGWPIHLFLAALVLPRAAFLGEALFDRDLHLDWYPRALVLARTLRSGLPPVWDLSIGFGQPLLGDPSAQVLYPTSWLAPLLAPWVLYTVYAVLHLAFSAVGMTCLARAAGLRKRDAVVAGAAYMLGGPMVSLVDLWHHLAGAAWIPWVVLAVHRAARRPSLRSALTLGVCLGLQVLAGSGDMVLLTAALSAAWLVAVGPPLTSRRAARGAGALALGTALAALLSAGQWIPAVDLASRGVRRELPQNQMVEWSVPPAGLVRVALPLDATPGLAYTRRAQKGLFDSERGPFLGSLYVGVVGISLALAALRGARHRRLCVVLAVAAALAILVALGRYSPVYSAVVSLVPGAAHLRYPSKAMVGFGFCMALLAGLGLAAVRSREKTRRIGTALALTGAVMLLTAAVLFGPAVRVAIHRGLLLDRSGAEADALPLALRLAAEAGLAALAGVAMLWREGIGARASISRPLVVAGCLVADLLLAHHDLNPTAPRGLLALRPPVLSAIDRRDHARTYVYEYMILAGASEQLLGRPFPYTIPQPAPGIDPRPLAALAQRLYPVAPVLGTWGVEGSYDLDLRGLQPAPQWGLDLTLRRAEGTPIHRRLLQMGAVRTVISLHTRGLEDLVPGPTFASLFPEPVRTWGVPGARPRAYVVGRARAIEGPAAIQALVEPGFDPASEAILSGEGAPGAASSARGGKGTVRIAELRADRERLEADLDGPGIVVTVDAWDPGWRAWVDGRSTRVLRANGAFRAVPVPAGRHVVEMRYRPWPVAVGVSLSGLALMVLLAGAVSSYGSRARRR
jgi:hypothetical protein